MATREIVSGVAGICPLGKREEITESAIRQRW